MEAVELGDGRRDRDDEGEGEVVGVTEEVGYREFVLPWVRVALTEKVEKYVREIVEVVVVDLVEELV